MQRSLRGLTFGLIALWGVALLRAPRPAAQAQEMPTKPHRFVVGVTAQTAPLVASSIAACRQQQPELTLVPQTLSSTEALKALQTGRVHLVLLERSACPEEAALFAASYVDLVQIPVSVGGYFRRTGTPQIRQGDFHYLYLTGVTYQQHRQLTPFLRLVQEQAVTSRD
ncbi:hypothetical protein [Armatimonas sp.]|uniref:hypothetical protein n=1 Tax=Armatimonas sp. TaxID=1872638 RepID=UPI00286A83F6|nr:hypothetical protein [Armatimonas sp.]